MVEKKKEEKCSPCEKAAMLQVGDKICHRLGRKDCHDMAHKVEAGKMPIDNYFDKLEKSAKDDKDKQKIQNIRKMFNV